MFFREWERKEHLRETFGKDLRKRCYDIEVFHHRIKLDI